MLRKTFLKGLATLSILLGGAGLANAGTAAQKCCDARDCACAANCACCTDGCKDHCCCTGKTCCEGGACKA